jgi:hypothetical protein
MSYVAGADEVCRTWRSATAGCNGGAAGAVALVKTRREAGVEGRDRLLPGRAVAVTNVKLAPATAAMAMRVANAKRSVAPTFTGGVAE